MTPADTIIDAWIVDGAQGLPIAWSDSFMHAVGRAQSTGGKVRRANVTVGQLRSWGISYII